MKRSVRIIAMRCGSFDARAPRERALGVAALRVAVVGMMLITNEPREALRSVLSAVPWIAPEGLGWFAHHVSRSPVLFSGIRTVYYAAGVLSFIGVYTRIALAILLVSAFALFGLAQLGGAVLHDMHLLWFLALLVSCPSGNALSVDEWFRTTRGDGLSRRLLGADEGTEGTVAFGCALFFVRTLLGIIYLFPGFWKARESGFAWALSDNLAHQMHSKWFEFGIVPLPRIDRLPGLMRALGLSTLAFEIAFLGLVHIGPRTRIALAAIGVAFHVSIDHFMLIPFSSLWTGYVALVPWKRAQTPGLSSDLSLRSSPRTSRSSAAGAGLVAAVGSALVVLNTVQGLRGQTQSFPFSCYPTFQWMAPATLVDLDLSALSEDGTSRDLPHGRDAWGRRTQREWGTVWSVAGVYGRPFSVDTLERYLDAERRLRRPVERALVGARAVRASLVWRLTDPDAWGAPPVRVRELAVIPLRAP